MTIIYIISAVILSYIVLVLAPGVVMFNTIFCRKQDKNKNNTYGNGHCADKVKNDFVFGEICGAKPERLTAISADKTELVGYYYRAGQGKLAICMHGYNACAKDDFETLAPFLFKNGYDILLAVQRAHSESGGKRSAMGILEQQDVLAWCDLICNGDYADKVVLAGVSMGCSTIAYASDKITNTKVKAMILDCGFISPYKQLEQESRKRHLPSKLIMPVISCCAKLFLRENIATPAWKSLEKTDIPAFFMHGTADTTVTIEATKENCAHCASPKQMYIVENASHTKAFAFGGKDAENTLNTFLKIYVDGGTIYG